MTKTPPTQKKIFNPTPPRSQRAWVITTVAIVLTATALRLALNFRYPMAPATDGAYYPLQTWWLIEHGRLIFHDLPLMFWLNAAATHLIRAVADVDLDTAVMLASRLIDGVAQPWAAVPIMLLGYTWSDKHRGALLGCAAAAVLAVMSPPIIRMASDFQKNSLGLVWMVFSLWALREALAHRRRPWRWGCLALFVALAGLTHIGAFGVTCVMLGVAAMTYPFAAGPIRVTRKGLITTGAALAGIGALVLIMLWLEPIRTNRLLQAPWKVINLTHPRLAPPTLALCLVVYGLLAWFLRSTWLDRRNTQPCDRAVILGAAAAEAALVFPFMEGDYAMRFSLMAIVPGAVLIAWVMSKRAATGKPRGPARALAVAAALMTLPAPWMMQGPPVSTAAADELHTFREVISDPTNTLVVAPHAVVFWAGIELHTPVCLANIPDDAFTQYDRVLIVQSKPDAPGRRDAPPPDRDPHAPPRTAAARVRRKTINTNSPSPPTPRSSAVARTSTFTRCPRLDRPQPRKRGPRQSHKPQNPDIPTRPFVLYHIGQLTRSDLEDTL